MPVLIDGVNDDDQDSPFAGNEAMHIKNAGMFLITMFMISIKVTSRGK